MYQKDSKRIGSEDGNSAISIQFAPEQVIESSERGSLGRWTAPSLQNILIVNVT